MGIKDLIDIANGKTGIILKNRDSEFVISAEEVRRLFKESNTHKKDGVITIELPDWLLDKAKN